MRNNWRWIAGGIATIVVIALIVGVVRVYSSTPEEESVATPTTEEVVEMEIPAEAVPVVVVPSGRTATHASAYLSIPQTESFIFQFEDAKGIVVSDSDGGPTDGYVGDIEIFLLPEASQKEIFPVVYFNGERFAGSGLLP